MESIRSKSSNRWEKIQEILLLLLSREKTSNYRLWDEWFVIHVFSRLTSRLVKQRTVERLTNQPGLLIADEFQTVTYRPRFQDPVLLREPTTSHRLTLDLWLAKDNRFLNPKSSYERFWRHLHVGSSNGSVVYCQADMEVESFVGLETQAQSTVFLF